MFLLLALFKTGTGNVCLQYSLIINTVHLYLLLAYYASLFAQHEPQKLFWRFLEGA